MTIEENEFGVFQPAYLGVELYWKGAEKCMFINLDNIQNILLDKKQKELSIIMGGSEDIIIKSQNSNSLYSKILKIYQEEKMKSRPSFTECKATCP